MTTFAFPSLAHVVGPASMRWSYRANNRVQVSPLSGSVQTIELPGMRWVLSCRFPHLYEADHGAMEGFLARLRGQAHRFTCFDFSAPVPRGTMRGTLTTVGSTAAGATTITITGGGGQAGATWLVGDKFAVAGELKIVVLAATANGSGQVTLTFEPPMRATVATGAAVTWDRPLATFMLAGPEAGKDADGSKPGAAQIDFDAVEVW